MPIKALAFLPTLAQTITMEENPVSLMAVLSLEECFWELVLLR
jgi:hypothetical protein